MVRRLCAFVVLVGCGGGGGGSEVAAECNALGSTGCVLPWPSAVYEREDATSATGVRLDLPLAPAVTLTAEAPLPPSAAQPESEPAVSPPVSRRLASLSTLLI